MTPLILTLLHTSPAHIPTFDALRDRIAPGATLTHLVREDFLSRAQKGVDAALDREISELIVAQPGKVLCTCTTIAEVARRAGAIRIDQPMMAAAAQNGGAVLMVFCLQSTWKPSLTLLDQELSALGRPTPIQPLFLGEFWPLFEAGETAAFAAVIAGAAKRAVKDHPDIGVVVLAQASMAGAASLLADLSVPVLTSPESALHAGLGL